MKFEIIQNPSSELQRFLWDELRQYGLNKLDSPKMAETEFLSILLKEEEEIVGGILAYMYFRGMNFQLLWVREDCRGKGYGQALLEQLEEKSKSLNCTVIFGSSFGFQAPKFYTKFGYNVFGVIENYPPGQNYYFLSKPLKY